MENSLALMRPDIAAEWDYEANGDLTPSDVTVGSGKKVGWKCIRDERHRWEATINNRTKPNGTGCPYCAGRKPVKGETDLATLRPEIAAEWDYEVNGDLTPSDVTVNCRKKVGWKCIRDERHLWEAIIGDRTKPNGTGCPYCAGKKPVKGENDLATLRPEIAAEWDYEANGKLTPSDVTVSCRMTVGWKCSIDERHLWKAAIYHRTEPNGTGCPYCAGKKPVKGVNDLATLRPEIAAEWDYEVNGDLTPSDVTVSSHMTVGWKCSIDERHLWKAAIYHRTEPNGTGCPYCAGKEPVKGVNDLATLRPEIAAEWDYEANGKLTPQDVTVSSGKKVGWKCRVDERHRWSATIASRTSDKGSGCPYCAGREPVKGVNDLATLRPEIAAEWDYEANGKLTPQDVTVSSGKTVGWKCRIDEQHRWRAIIYNRTKPNGTGCPHCKKLGKAGRSSV